MEEKKLHQIKVNKKECPSKVKSKVKSIKKNVPNHLGICMRSSNHLKIRGDIWWPKISVSNIQFNHQKRLKREERGKGEGLNQT